MTLQFADDNPLAALWARDRFEPRRGLPLACTGVFWARAAAPAAGGDDDADDGAGAAASAIAAAIALHGLETSLDDQSSLGTVAVRRAFRPPPLRGATVAVLDPLAFPHGKLHHASRGPAAAAAAAAAADVGVDGASDGGGAR